MLIALLIGILMDILLLNCGKNKERYALQLLSEGEDYKVHSAESSAEAIEIYRYRGRSIHIIICDIDECGDGAKELAQFNFTHLFLPFVIVSSMKDATHALELLEFGVHDYLIKPVPSGRIFTTIKNAISRREVTRHLKDDKNPYPGNVEKILIPTRSHELQRAVSWIEEKASQLIKCPEELSKYTCLVGEFLTNAYEHGNLALSEKEKGELVRKGTIFSVLEKREKECSSSIKVGVSILKNEIAVSISDEGKGFRYKNYLNMSKEEIVNRIEMPNGRGIVMGRSYFDRIEYSDNGSTVLLVKTFPA